MRPDKRLERQLFEKEIQQITGINFDRYDNIPVETSGSDCPPPIDTYDAETIGEELFRNTQLCGYTKPTPVQKWSIPIASANRGVTSLGFIITQAPASKAGMVSMKESVSGKFHGLITPTKL